MSIIKILPELCALIFSIMVAIIGFSKGMTLREVSINTLVSIFAFYIVGEIIKRAIIRLRNDTIIGMIKESWKEHKASMQENAHKIDYAVGKDDETEKQSKQAEEGKS